MSYAYYARATALKHIQKLNSDLKAFQKTKDSECLHQARTAGRKLRNDLWIFKSVFARKKRKAWMKSLQGLLPPLGQLRDLDLEIDYIVRLGRRTPGRALKTQLRKISLILGRKRGRLCEKIIGVTEDFERTKTLKKIKKTLRKFPEHPGAKGEAFLYYFSYRKITRRLADFLRYESYVKEPRHMIAFHNMRIAAKKLRYTLECFDPFYKGRLKEYARNAEDFQDVLGWLHDFDVWFRMTKQELSPKEQKELKKAVVYFLKICKDEKNKAYHQFLATWDTALKNKVWKKLTEEVGAAHGNVKEKSQRQ
jgi:CHAD domain-containing protein